MSNLRQEYERHAHRMQTGVSYEMNEPGDTSTTPKHLRVGINAAMADHAGLADLLISKGVITEEEYLDALVASMKAEADSYERTIQARLGAHVKLG